MDFKKVSEATKGSSSNIQGDFSEDSDEDMRIDTSTMALDRQYLVTNQQSNNIYLFSPRSTPK